MKNILRFILIVVLIIASFDKANILDNQIDGEFIPIRIIIPQANVDTEIEPMETIAGQLQAPKNFSIVGWDKTRVPLVTNTIIMDGHYDSKKGPAVFYNLKSLKPDDKIYILSENEILIYNVTLIEAYDRLNAPIEKIYGDNGKKRLNLITCHGQFDRSAGTHNQRLIVYSELEE